VAPAPTTTPPAATNQVTTQQYYPVQPARYVVQRPASKSKADSSTNSPPPVPRGPEDAPKIAVSNEDPIVEYQKADAAKGFPEAQYALGMRYLSGNGVTQDESKGKELIKLAADQGSERAREKLRELRDAGKL
jgi:TPR repeat protein